MLELLAIACKIFHKYGCGKLEITEKTYDLTLKAEGWFKAQAALRGLKENSPRIDILPHFVGEDPEEYEYIIWKAKTSTKRMMQKLSIVLAALMASENTLSETGG